MSTAMAGVFDDVKRSLTGTAQEPLELIPEKSFTELSNFLFENAPNSLPALGMVENVIRWRKNANMPADQKLYAPFGDFENGTCVGIYDTDFVQITTFYAKNADSQKLRDALLTTNLLNWGSNTKKMYMLWEIPEDLVPVVKEAAIKKNMQISCYPTVHFWMEKEQAIKLEVRCPPGVKIKTLEGDHIEYLDQHWPHRFDGSQHFLRALLERNFGLGVFVEGDEMPVAWVVLDQNNCMGMLFTVDAHRRKGYAEIVCNAMAKKLAEMDIFPRANVLETNRSSRTLFEKMGYKSSHVVHYIDLISK